MMHKLFRGGTALERKVNGYSSIVLRRTDLAKRKETMRDLNDLMRQIAYCFETEVL